MLLNLELWVRILLAVAIAFAISFAAVPVVKTFATKVGAIDIPDGKRRVHDHPIPRMGGLAIFLGFLLSVVLFADITRQVRGILIGAVLIVACGAIDDVVNLRAWIKLLVQVAAAVIGEYPALAGLFVVVTNQLAQRIVYIRCIRRRK